MNNKRDKLVLVDQALSAKEVCTMLGIGKNTLYQWCELGFIPHKRVGGSIDIVTGKRQRGRILFSRRRILEWLENRENQN
ncbi:helix-turn-helix domain-containing protein [Chloroflexota bacterium]